MLADCAFSGESEGVYENYEKERKFSYDLYDIFLMKNCNVSLFLDSINSILLCVMVIYKPKS